MTIDSVRVVDLPDGSREWRRASLDGADGELALALQRESDWLDSRWRELWAQGR